MRRRKDSAAEMKGLRSQLRRLRLAQEALVNQGRGKSVDAARIAHHIRRVEGRMATLKQRSGGVLVTEHAMLRYLERVEGLDLDELRAKILPTDVRKKIKALRGADGMYPCQAGFKIRLHDGAIVTVITRESA